jgi:DNA-binding Lrp family transcriptional regulator
MHLTENERLVIQAYELDADLSYALGSKKTGLSEKQIRYALQSLQDRKVLRYYPFINIYPLGYSPFLLFVSLHTTSESVREETLETIKKSQVVSWFTKFEGVYDYCISIVARDTHDFLHQADALFSKKIISFPLKSVVQQTSLTLFQAKYIGKPKTVRHVSWEHTGDRYALDDTDKKVLSSLMHTEYRSKRDLARNLSMPSSTLDDRLSMLVEHGVLQKFVYLIDPKMFGFRCYKLLLTSKVINTKLTKLLFEYCRDEPNCIIFITCVGAWDYEVGIEVHSDVAAQEFKERLAYKFAQVLSSVVLLDQREELKDFCYPFIDNRID